jgi:hypothetical protein
MTELQQGNGKTKLNKEVTEMAKIWRGGKTK